MKKRKKGKGLGEKLGGEAPRNTIQRGVSLKTEKSQTTGQKKTNNPAHGQAPFAKTMHPPEQLQRQVWPEKHSPFGPAT